MNRTVRGPSAAGPIGSAATATATAVKVRPRRRRTTKRTVMAPSCVGPRWRERAGYAARAAVPPARGAHRAPGAFQERPAVGLGNGTRHLYQQSLGLDRGGL